MKKCCVLLTALLTLSLLMTACNGAAEETNAENVETDPIVETITEETSADAEETEEETTKETQKEMTSFTDYIKLTVEEGKGVYDAGLGAFVVQFTDDKVRYLADDACSIGISGDGEASSMAGSIDMNSHPEFTNGDYYTGIVVKPDETVYEGTYKITITFAMYIVTFTCTIG